MKSPSPLRRLLPYLAALAILLLAAAAFATLVKTKPEAPARPSKEKVWTVDAVPAELQRVAPRITLYGRIESPRSSELSAAVTAFVQSLDVDEGSWVESGDTLLRLDPRDAQLVVDRRRAQLKDIQARIQTEINRHRSDIRALAIEKELVGLTERTVDRFRELKGRKVGSDTQIEDAQRSYQQQALALNNRQRDIDDHPNRLNQLHALEQQAQSQLETALLDLERTTIQAPFGGRVARVDVAPGDRVRSGDPLLMMYNTASLEVRAQIPSRYLNPIRSALSQGASLRATGQLDDKALDLTLHRIAGEVGDGQAGIDALLRIASDPRQLELGRALELELELPEISGVLSLPPQALYGTDRIYRIKDDRLDAMTVERIGEAKVEGKPRILVRSAEIQPGDAVVTTQLPNAITGLKVSRAER